MLLSILYDVLEQEEGFFYHRCQHEYRNHRRKRLPIKWVYTSLKKLIESLQDYTTTKPFYLILDAVDESEESDRREILKLFADVCSKAKNCVIKIFVASRPVVQLEVQLEARKDQFHIIRLQDETLSDIRNFTHSLLDGLHLDHLFSEAITHIVENAQGVFLWVKLVGDELITAHENGYSRQEVFQLLKGLPTELKDVYAHMLKKMQMSESPISHKIKRFKMLQLILFARRLLTVDELLHALGVPSDVGSDPEFTPSDDVFRNQIPSSERIILSCGGNFIEIKQNNCGHIFLK